MTEIEKKIKQNALNFIDGYDIKNIGSPNSALYYLPIPYTLDGLRNSAIDRLVFSVAQNKFIAVEYYYLDGDDVKLRKIYL